MTRDVDQSDPSRGCLCLQLGGATQRWKAKEGKFPRKGDTYGVGLSDYRGAEPSAVFREASSRRNGRSHMSIWVWVELLEQNGCSDTL